MQYWNLFKPLIAVAISSLFSRIVVLGWLTPEQASELTKWLMDGLAVMVPAILGVWLVRDRTPTALIATTAALPEVTKVATTPEIAEKIPDPTVQPATAQDKTQVIQAAMH